MPFLCVLQTLVRALDEIATSLPDLLEEIQGQLLDLLSLMLAHKPFQPATSRATIQNLLNSVAASDLREPQLVVLALTTIGEFDFGKVSQLQENRRFCLGVSCWFGEFKCVLHDVVCRGFRLSLVWQREGLAWVCSMAGFGMAEFLFDLREP